MIALLCALSVAAGAMPPPPAHPGALGPRLVAAGDELIVSWMEPVDEKSSKQGKAIRVMTSSFDGLRWTRPEVVVTRSDAFANWADFPSVTVALDGTRYAHWLQKRTGGKYAYDVHLARKSGRQWKHIGVLHDDGVAAEHGFVSTVPLADGVRFFWLDGRNTVADGPMTLRTARVVDGRVIDRALVDDRVCDCCATAAAQTPNGPRVVYRDRSNEEIRDVATSLVVAGKPRSPKPVHVDGWKMPGCPVNGPALVSSSTMTAVAWFTMAGETATVKAAFLPRDAVAFGAPIVVASGDTLGRVDLVLDGGQALVSSLTRQGEVGVVEVRRVAPDGRVGAPVELGRTASSRLAGFPQVERFGDELIAVWTQAEGETTTLAAKRVKLSAIKAPAGSWDSRTVHPVTSAPAQKLRLKTLTAVDGAGRQYRLRPGRPVLLHFWATWCTPCLSEMPELLSTLRPLQKEGVDLWLVSMDDPPGHARAKALSEQWHSADLLRFTPQAEPSGIVDWNVLPTTVLLNADGDVVERWEGVTELETIREVSSALGRTPSRAKKPGTRPRER